MAAWYFLVNCVLTVAHDMTCLVVKNLQNKLAACWWCMYMAQANTVSALCAKIILVPDAKTTITVCKEML